MPQPLRRADCQISPGVQTPARGLAFALMSPLRPSWDLNIISLHGHRAARSGLVAFKLLPVLLLQLDWIASGLNTWGVLFQV